MMYTKEQAYAEIVKLVNTFKTNEARLNIEAEAQIENNFIRPLFKYLNWNTENDGLAIPDYEFVVQRTNRYGKRPDYILQLDGQHLLVIDAKQVKLDMHDPRWMNQVYAYAYSTQNLSLSRKIDFAILTDFQEFVALDCTLYAGKPKAVANFRVLDWRYDEYLTKFDTLWQLFERENMRQAARTRGTDAPAGLWARALSPKKVKANRIPPDKAFLMEMDDDKTGWRVRLAKDMKKHNPEADGALITAAVQLLIDRLIFVKALSDREIEDDYLSQLAETVERDGLAESNIGWFTACRTIFTKLNEFYNGSIFESRPELEAVTVSNKVVRAIIHDLQPENSSYNFAVLPVEILGTIYERFLGRVVRTTDKQVKIEDKPEVRKAGGVYYTPQYIVNYIVQNTVGKLLEKCRTPEDVAKLQVLDPACGSGSFLLGAYNALIGWYISYYSDKGRLTKRDRAVAYHDSDGCVRLTAKLKRQILLNNLYGVDIDMQAVEVTRFSLSLKALEDIRQDEVYEERNLFKQTVLPDLSQNIKCGNSLIGPDYFTGQMFSDTDELKRVNPFDWGHEFAQGGFNAVIGNPPYISVELTVKDATEYYLRKYQSAYGRVNSFSLFVEKGLALLKPSGLCGLIVSNRILTNTQLAPLRQLLLKTSTIYSILTFKKTIFKATVDTVVITFQKAPPPAEHLIEIWHDIIGLEARDFGINRIAQSTYLKNNSFIFNVRQHEDVGAILQKVESGSVELQTICDVRDGIILGGIKDLFLSEKRLHSKYEKWLEGNEVSRYSICWVGRYICYDKTLTKIEMQRKHETAKQKAKSGLDFDKIYQSGVRLRTPEIFRQEKILTRQNAKRLIGVLDDSHYFVKNSLHCILQKDRRYSLRYILGVINSRLMDIYFQNRIGSTGEIFSQMKIAYIERLPIRAIDFADPANKARHDKMVQLVESMLALHKHKAAAKTQADQDLYQRQIEATDREIDVLVYELYGLTPDEIATVEALR